MDWFQFSYTGDLVGAYVAPASMVLVWSVVSEGETFFFPTLMHLRWSYPGAYAPLPKYMMGPPETDYYNYQPVVGRLRAGTVTHVCRR